MVSVVAHVADGSNSVWTHSLARNEQLAILMAQWAARHGVPASAMACECATTGRVLDQSLTPHELDWAQGARVLVYAYPRSRALAEGPRAVMGPRDSGVWVCVSPARGYSVGEVVPAEPDAATIIGRRGLVNLGGEAVFVQWTDTASHGVERLVGDLLAAMADELADWHRHGHARQPPPPPPPRWERDAAVGAQPP